jgi:23S rRNA pseudouridine1911/1915/1917 synthase
VTGEQIHLSVSRPGGRLDRLLAESLPQSSRTRIQDWIRDGRVAVDGQAVRKPGQQLSGGENVLVEIPETRPSTLEPEPIPLEVIFENHDLLIVNKPPGMVVHPAAGHSSGTLVHAALSHAPDLRGVGGEARPGVVHRLDKDTSGLILLAKDDRTHQYLQRLFKDRRIEKTYLALVDGHPPTPSGRIEAPVGRDLHQRKRMAVVPAARGRSAVTQYRVTESFRDHTLLEVHPETGRTHQIRVHLAFVGCPVVADRVYGKKKASLWAGRQMLHAWRLRLTLPGEAEAREFEAPLPEDFVSALGLLRARG